MYTCVCVCGGGTFCFREESGCCGSRQTLTYFTAVDREDNFFPLELISCSVQIQISGSSCQQKCRHSQRARLINRAKDRHGRGDRASREGDSTGGGESGGEKLKIMPQSYLHLSLSIPLVLTPRQGRPAMSVREKFTGIPVETPRIPF